MRPPPSHYGSGAAKYETMPSISPKKDTSSFATHQGAVSFCELFKFASFSDKLLIIIGSVFAIIEGAGAPAMALVFGGMTNTLVDVVQNAGLCALLSV